jgi:hypothetical protein
MPKRTPEETWAALQEQVADDLMDEVLAMTPEEIRRELAAAGFDLSKSDAIGEALAEQFRRGEVLRPTTESGTFPAASATRESPPEE